jgi:hypothetical protein
MLHPVLSIGSSPGRPELARRGRLSVLTATFVVLLAGALGGVAAFAAKPPASPKPGAWKIILAQNTPHGPIVTKKVIGGFRVSRHRTITGFHLTFTEEGESAECAGGSPESPKSGTLSIPSTPAIPIVKAGMTWQVAAGTGALGGGTLQPAEVVVLTPRGTRSPNSRLSITLVTRKGLHSGGVEWNEQHCNVAFVVQPG